MPYCIRPRLRYYKRSYLFNPRIRFPAHLAEWTRRLHRPNRALSSIHVIFDFIKKIELWIKFLILDLVVYIPSIVQNHQIKLWYDNGTFWYQILHRQQPKNKSNQRRCIYLQVLTFAVLVHSCYPFDNAITILSHSYYISMQSCWNSIKFTDKVACKSFKVWCHVITYLQLCLIMQS